MTLDFRVRGRHVDDTELLFSSWLKSNLANVAYKQMPPETYWYQHHRIIESYMDDATTAWVIAHAPDDPRFIYGWICGQVARRPDESVSPVVHFVYVKQDFRRLGVASQLLKLMGVNQHVAAITTHRTARGDQLLESMKAVQLYNPYLAWARCPVVEQVPVERLARDQKVHDRAVKASRKALAWGGFEPTPKKAV
jgi:GNAT superfamily N-acetyltransferase